MITGDEMARHIGAARPRAVAALLRYFRDLDLAEEAFQEASLRALRAWTAKGLPDDPAAWLIFVGRNASVDETRRRARLAELPPDESFSFPGDADVAEQLDGRHWRDDVLRLLFICCHPALPPHHQIALALRIISGLSVQEIARAFLVGEAAMEQRITRAKRRIAGAGVPFEPPDAGERAARVSAVAALLLLQHARVAARLDADGEIVLLEQQDRSRWNAEMIAEGTVLVEKAQRHRQPGPLQLQAAIAAIHGAATRAEETDWAEIDQLYAALERLQPSPVVTLNRAVAVSKLHGPEAALAMIEPLAGPLERYFHFHGLRGALLRQAGRHAEARVSLQRAIALAHTPAEATHIRAVLDQLSQ